MSYYEGPLIFPDGTPVIPDHEPHVCLWPTGWLKGYSHTTVATILTNTSGEIAAVVKRHPEEPAEGGKLALPGGYVELGETVAQTAIKETLEETGYEIVPRTLGMFALLDGPATGPGRHNEHDLNVVFVFNALAGRKAQEHDKEVTGVFWISEHTMPPPGEIAFGHHDVMGMWFRHRIQPFPHLPIVPSSMDASELYLPNWPPAQ